MADRLAKRRAESRQDMFGVFDSANGLTFNRKLTGHRFILLVTSMTGGELTEYFGQRIRFSGLQRFRKCGEAW